MYTFLDILSSSLVWDLETINITPQIEEKQTQATTSSIRLSREFAHKRVNLIFYFNLTFIPSNFASFALCQSFLWFTSDRSSPIQSVLTAEIKRITLKLRNPLSNFLLLTAPRLVTTLCTIEKRMLCSPISLHSRTKSYPLHKDIFTHHI